MLAWRLVEGGWPLSWSGPAILVVARALAAELFRLNRLRWCDWRRDDNFIWGIASLSGSVMAVLSAHTLAIELPAAVAAVDLLLYLQAGSLVASRRAPDDGPAGVSREPVLIYGAGGQGRLLADELGRSTSRYEAIGWLDDDPDKAEAVLAGLPVLGTIRALPFLAELHGVRTVFTAIPGLTTEASETAQEMAEMADVRLCVLPTVRDALRAAERAGIAA